MLIISAILGVLFILMAIHDTGNYKKAGPRELLFLFIGLWFIGFITGLTF